MRRIGIHRALRTIHPPRDLLRERIDRRPRPRPRHRPGHAVPPAWRSSCDRTPPTQRHRVTCRPDRTLPGSSIISSADLTAHRPPRSLVERLIRHAKRHPGRSLSTRPGRTDGLSGENARPPAGNFDGRQWGFPMAAVTLSARVRVLAVLGLGLERQPRGAETTRAQSARPRGARPRRCSQPRARLRTSGRSRGCSAATSQERDGSPALIRSVRR
jgi:hypothetical protein